MTLLTDKEMSAFGKLFALLVGIDVFVYGNFELGGLLFFLVSLWYLLM